MTQPVCSAAGALQNGNLVVTIHEPHLREAATAYRIRDEINAMIDAQKPQNIVLDLTDVKFIGSVGFLAFLGVRRHLGAGRIVLANLSDSTRDIFSICRLIPTTTNQSAPFEVAATVEEALSRLAS
jgi:anti-anti-sigma factor